MMKHQIRMKRSQDLRFSRRFATLVVFLFIALMAAVFLALTLKDIEIEQIKSESYRKDELLQKKDRIIAEKDREIERLEDENRELRQRLKILDIIEEFNPELSEEEQTSLGGVIHEESQRYGYEPALLLALIYTESSFRPDARSYKGARGLMQILPSVGEELGPEVKKLHGVEVKDAQSLENPEVNVKVGAYYLFKLILKFGDVKNAIKAYNEGPTDIQRRLDRGKTMPRRYYRKILKNYRMIKDFLLERQEEQRRLALENERRRHVAPQNLKPQPSTP